MDKKKLSRLEKKLLGHVIDNVLLPAVPAITAALVDLLQGRGGRPARPEPGKRNKPGDYIPFEEIK